MSEYFKGPGGRAIYGMVFGIIMNEGVMPRVPGDSGNASSYPFPTVIRPVHGGHERIVRQEPRLLEECIEAIRELERIGVRAITTTCGFYVIWQEEFAKVAKVPVFSSSLMQLPVVQKMVPAGKKIGIITTNGKAFAQYRKELLCCSGLDPSTPVVIRGMEDQKGWSYLTEDPTHERARSHKPRVKSYAALDQKQTENDVAEVARGMLSDDPSVGAIVFECHNLPPFGKAVQDATGVPVFDIMTLVDMMYRATVQRRYTGIM